MRKAAILFLLLILGCRDSNSPGNVSANGKGVSTGGIAKPVAWKQHNDPMGFSAQYPPDWKIIPDKRTGRVEFQGNATEQLFIWPFFIAGKNRFDASAADDLLRSIAAQLFPQASWDSPQSVSRNAARMTGQQNQKTIVTSLTWIESSRGVAGFVYGMAASQQQYRNAATIFARIAESFRLQGGPAAGPREPSIQYIKWQDPKEQAFFVEVPSGWSVQGGLFRFASLDVRGALELVSPDQKIRITAGDVNIPTFCEPTDTLVSLGFYEGTWYQPGPGGRMLIKRYTPGLPFAIEYVQSSVARYCGPVQITNQRERSDIVKAVNGIYAQYNSDFVSYWTAGDVGFTCGQNRGYYLAATSRLSGYGAGVWNIQYLYGYVAIAEQEETARSVLTHMINTTRPNPQWVSMQQGITANTSAIAARTSQEISNIISGSYWSTQNTYDELSRRRSNATLGIEDVVDPATGTSYRVESGSNYYWVNDRGQIVGTDVFDRPAVDYRELTRLP